MYFSYLNLILLICSLTFKAHCGWWENLNSKELIREFRKKRMSFELHKKERLLLEKKRRKEYTSSKKKYINYLKQKESLRKKYILERSKAIPSKKHFQIKLERMKKRALKKEKARKAYIKKRNEFYKLKKKYFFPPTPF